MPSEVRSLVEVDAERVPRKTRRPRPRDPDSLRVSTWPMRTLTLNSSPSRTTASASEAPALMASDTTSAVRDSMSRVVGSGWAADWGMDSSYQNIDSRLFAQELPVVLLTVLVVRITRRALVGLLAVAPPAICVVPGAFKAMGNQ